MTYSGGVRQVQADGSILLEGSLRAPRGLAIGAFVVPLGLLAALAQVRTTFFPSSLLSLDPSPFWARAFTSLGALAIFAPVVTLWVLAFRAGTRTVRFDRQRHLLEVEDLGPIAEPKWSLAFRELRTLALVQREPRPLAAEAPTLVVNGRDLLTVKDCYENSKLETELALLVGLAAQESTRDSRGLSAS